MSNRILKIIEQNGQLRLRKFKLVASLCRDVGKHGGSAVYICNEIHAKECNKISQNLNVVHPILF